MTPPAPREPSGPAAWGAVVAPVVAARTGRRHPELDTYTAIAVLASVVFTVYQFCSVGAPLYQGTPAYALLGSFDAAVPWFFVLIGYRLFTPVARAVIDGRTAISTRTLVTGPVIRLVPAYYAVILVVWFSRQQTLPGDWRDLLEHLTFTQVFDHRRIFYTDGPAWAVSVAAWFVVVVALVNVILARIGPRLATGAQRILALAMPPAVLGLVALIWKAWSLTVAHRPATGSSTTWYGPLANLDNLALGMAVALGAAVLGRSRLPGIRGRTLLRLTAAAILFTAFTTRHVDGWTEVFFTTVCSTGFACLLAAALARPDGRNGERLRRPMTWFATIAYSTYLWHEPVLLALHNWFPYGSALDGWVSALRQRPDAFIQDSIVVVIVSTLTGWLSYLCFEHSTQQLSGVLADGPERHPDSVPPTIDPVLL